MQQVYVDANGGKRMLEYKLTPQHAGIALWGDRAALVGLYDFIFRVIDKSPVIKDKEGFVLGLCYDLRKAYEGQRSAGWRFEEDEDRCRIYGVEILWPVVLIQMAVLRHAMGFIPTNCLDQAHMYELEHVVESALRVAMPEKADDVLHSTSIAGAEPYSHLDTILDSRCRYFISLPVDHRLKELPKLMETFNPMYGFLAETGIISRRRDFIPPSAFVDSGQEWPDFEW